MRSHRGVGAGIVALALAASVLAASPAQAAPQSLFGTTVDVFSPITSESLLGSTVYVPEITPLLVVEIGDAQATDIDVTALDGATTIDSCVIVAGGTMCGLSSLGGLPDGATPVTVQFVMGAATETVSGTVFVVTNDAPTFRLEWRDAAGLWVDGTGIGIALRGATALRCVITNNSNAAITFDTVTAMIELNPSGTEAVPITGTLAAGAVGRFTVWSGLAPAIYSASCSGGVDLRDGTGAGGGNGGGVIAMGGTITIDRTPAPGQTVTITADGVTPPLVTEYSVLLDGVPVSGSPVSAPPPDFGFMLDIAVPTSLAVGDHVISVVVTYQGRDTAIAAFPFQVAAPELAATGAELDASSAAWSGLVGLLVVAAGAGLLAASRRRHSG